MLIVGGLPDFRNHVVTLQYEYNPSSNRYVFFNEKQISNKYSWRREDVVLLDEDQRKQFEGQNFTGTIAGVHFDNCRIGETIERPFDAAVDSKTILLKRSFVLLVILVLFCFWVVCPFFPAYWSLMVASLGFAIWLSVAAALFRSCWYPKPIPPPYYSRAEEGYDGNSAKTTRWEKAEVCQDKPELAKTPDLPRPARAVGTVRSHWDHRDERLRAERLRAVSAVEQVLHAIQRVGLSKFVNAGNKTSKELEEINSQRKQDVQQDKRIYTKPIHSPGSTKGIRRRFETVRAMYTD